jgi:hypothetical protein
VSDKIRIYVAPGEQNYERFNQLNAAVSSQSEHFELLVCGDLPFDIRFQQYDKILDIELKDISENDNSDYLSSVLSGHLYSQILEGRERSNPFALVVLGDDGDLQKCIKKAAANKSHIFDFKKFTQYSSLLDAFEANCIGCGIQVWHLGYNQFPRLLLRVRKILEGGDLSGFAPKPADGERKTVGLSILAGRGVGPKMAANILERYNLCLIRRDGYCGDLEDIPGIGPKRAETIKRNIEVMD